MGRRIASLTPAELPDLPTCDDAAAAVLTDTETWPRVAMDHLGLCGVVAHQNGRVVAHALVAPSFAVPDSHRLAQPPRTPDAAALLMIWVDDRYARLGWGRQLLQELAARLVGRVRVIEAATTVGRENCCEPSSEFLTALGFTPTELPDRYRFRLDQTLAAEPQWPRAVSRAVTKVAEWVQQPRPEPTSREQMPTSTGA